MNQQTPLLTPNQLSETRYNKFNFKQPSQNFNNENINNINNNNYNNNNNHNNNNNNNNNKNNNHNNNNIAKSYIFTDSDHKHVSNLKNGLNLNRINTIEK